MSDTVTHDGSDDVSHDNAYQGLVEADDDARWAFGTGFSDPLAGVDTQVPADVDGPALARYCLMLGDDALVAAQRLAEWSTRAPEIEEEVALANIGLDLIGQAHLLLARAAAADPTVVPALPAGSPVPPDDALAFFRDQSDFACVRLVELPNGDFARTVVRQLVFSAWRLRLLDALTGSTDPVLAAVAAKGVKEVTYHRDHAARWFVTLALGTDESRRRLEAGLIVVWPFSDDLARVHPVERDLVAAGVAADPAAAWAAARGDLDAVLDLAGTAVPDVPPAGSAGGRAGRDGLHTEWLGHLLDEMQSVARAHPLGRW